MSIILDNREHGLIPLILSAEVKQLPVGDIWICTDGKPVVVIERKTTADFESSFFDGRYREQRTRLLAFCAEQKAKPMYLLEGGVYGQLHKMEVHTMQKLMNRLMLRYGVAVWPTKHLSDTANTAHLLATQLKEDPKVFDGETLSYTDVMHVTKKANKEDPKAFACAALQGCPGVSAKAASAILETFTSLAGVMTQDEKAIAEVKVGERRLGPAVAKRLWNLLHVQQLPQVQAQP